MATVKKILETAAALLDMSEVTFTGSNVISNYDPTVLALVQCLNNVLEEIATEYIPFVKTETVALTDGRAEYTAFDNQVAEIIKVNTMGRTCKFLCYPSYVEVDTKESSADITYHYLPDPVTVTGSVGYLKLTPRLLALGLAADYALVVGRYEESVQFDKQYMYALQAAQRKGKEIIIPARRW